MPSDYNKLTKPDLEAQLKERGLPHSGKKADLVARLQEDDGKKQSSAAEPVAAAKEDEIDWDDDAPKDDLAVQPTAEAAQAAAPPTATPSADKETAEPSATTAPTESTQAADEIAAPEEKPQKDYSLGLAQVTISDELEKLKARAKKFGLTEDAAAQDNIAKLERAQKFGAAENLDSLNGALPERQRKRRADHAEDGRASKSRGRGGRSNGGRNTEPKREGRAPRQDNGNGPSWMSQKDREAAEARKKRFAGGS